ncbi:hypothetical protein LENED_003140 [Lentinula edodes]|uniref:Uncharacterized protein n=1 Tax=Lentinula edodes TaxID=5353 RepID=A0A1Q3E2Q3_LENED|nr:hypothetical protein LENED_003140 [Lentinula edodes]
MTRTNQYLQQILRRQDEINGPRRKGRGFKRSRVKEETEDNEEEEKGEEEEDEDELAPKKAWLEEREVE